MPSWEERLSSVGARVPGCRGDSAKFGEGVEG